MLPQKKADEFDFGNTINKIDIEETKNLLGLEGDLDDLIHRLKEN